MDGKFSLLNAISHYCKISMLNEISILHSAQLSGLSGNSEVIPFRKFYFWKKKRIEKFFFSWSHDGKQILTSSTDWSVGLWDVLSGNCETRYRFPSAIHKVQFHPRNRFQIFCIYYFFSIFILKRPIITSCNQSPTTWKDLASLVFTLTAGNISQ